MSTATVTSAPGWPTTVLQAQCRRCRWHGHRHDVYEVFAGLDAYAQHQHVLVDAEAAAHECDPAVLHLAAVIRAQPGDPMVDDLEDVIRAVLAVQAAEAAIGPDATDGSSAARRSGQVMR